MKEPINLYKIAPFPENWERNIDLVPSLTLQRYLDEKQELFFIRGKASKCRNIPAGTKKLESGVRVTRAVGTTTGAKVEFGEPNTSKEAVEDKRTHIEIFESIMAELGEFEDVTINQRATVHDIPKPLESFSVLDGVDLLYNVQQGIGSRHRSFRKLTNFPVQSPYRIIKAELLKEGFIQASNDPTLKRLKSVLITSYTLPSNDMGYMKLENFNLELQRGMRQDKFWQDTAIPWRAVADPVNSTEIVGYLMKLDARKHVILGV